MKCSFIFLNGVPGNALEHIFVSTIADFAGHSHITCKEEHGFHGGRSCENQLLGLFGRTHKLQERGKVD